MDIDKLIALAKKDKLELKDFYEIDGKIREISIEMWNQDFVRLSIDGEFSIVTQNENSDIGDISFTIFLLKGSEVSTTLYFVCKDAKIETDLLYAIIDILLLKKEINGD